MVGVGLRRLAAAVVAADRVVDISVRRMKAPVQLPAQAIETAAHRVPKVLLEESPIGHDMLQIILEDTVPLVDDVSRGEAAKRARRVAFSDQVVSKGVSEFSTEFGGVFRKRVPRMTGNVPARDRKSVV